MADLSFPPKLQFFDANGVPLVGGKLYSYAAGTTTPLATYTSSAETTFNPNPIILDSRGEAEVWLGSPMYKFKLTTPADVEIWTVDNITSLSNLETSLLAAIAASAAAVQASAVAKAGDTMTGALNFAPEVSLASAGTTDIGAANSNNVQITGTTAITNFGTAANGVTRELRFAGALTLTHNATSLILPGGANITTAAGDTGTAKSLGFGNWVVTDWQRAAALPALQGLITGSGLTAATARVLGRVTAATGAIEEIPLGNAAAALSLGINRGTEQATTSGTAIDFTSIPAGTRRITIAFNGVSTNGTSAKLIQIGNASFVTSGYVSSGGAIATGSAGGSSSTQGFLVGNFSLAADAINGIMTLTNISGNGWVMAFSGGSSAGNFGAVSGGFLSLGGALDRVRITTANGTDTFDAGAVNIMWEF